MEKVSLRDGETQAYSLAFLSDYFEKERYKAGRFRRPLSAVFVIVDNATQRMTVAVDAKSLHEFKISTGRFGLGTPRGTYKPERLHRYWYSRKYDNAPMPYSIFFPTGFQWRSKARQD